ncbi:GNAT family N-acetyltransferase [Kitasatospora sp. NBC_00315]|uniref:GNAT family N-acetyltransferase n=1 Tax=Kitasatospora sp. NBC_00315 TaxID=2975963 RepID=UPI00324CD486
MAQAPLRPATATTAPVRLATLGTAPVRPATGADAAALHALSEPFMRSGELRVRTAADYRAAVGQFLLVPGPPSAGPDGCVALRRLPAEPGHPAAGLLHNLCVRPERQGTGLGSRLLAALLDTAARGGLRTVHAATTGSGELFRRFGFVPIPAALAPRSWAAGLDPARGSEVYRRILAEPGRAVGQARPDLHPRAISQTR